MRVETRKGGTAYFYQRPEKKSLSEICLRKEEKDSHIYFHNSMGTSICLCQPAAW